jgi:predicted Fe-Mo cluster-binding NifX family protein
MQPEEKSSKPNNKATRIGFMPVYCSAEYIKILPNVSEHMGGKGLPMEIIFAAGVHVMIVGGLGPKAVSLFNQAGVEIFLGAVGTVKDAVDDWQTEMLTRADLDNACKDHKHKPLTLMQDSSLMIKKHLFTDSINSIL